MAAPNLISTTSIIGKTRAETLTTSMTAVLTNLANSGEVHRLNVLYVTNLGIADASVSAELYRGGVGYKIVYNLSVPVGQSIVAIGKDTSIYLEEDDSLRLSASQAGV